MTFKEPKKLDFTFKGQPVKARIYMQDFEAKVHLSGFDFSEPLTIADLDELSGIFANLTMDAVAYE